ncbi:hypothetical protein BGW38_000792 [Lunasporangiospora selenospora]|uniref:Uncharacterized protein n=1 Tax=Lunasporangiospora selenospora TaxID=979761 RepID=A0A9P6G2E9_9FUNG|nr:hypothetical protein BGW38_000792 [Lunasporangiospora selenospora]
MLSSITALVTLMAMAIVVTAQGSCGGIIGNGTFYTVKYYDTFTVVTSKDPYRPDINPEDYLLYCGLEDPNPPEFASIRSRFQIPLLRVAVGQNATGSFLELLGQREKIVRISKPDGLISPCLQALTKNQTIGVFDNADPNAYIGIDGAFVDRQHTSQDKDIWIPNAEVDPIERLAFIKPVSLFFGQGQRGEDVFSKIKTGYEDIRDTAKQIDQSHKKRIGWVQYDSGSGRWELVNTLFVRTIIRDAGGVSFPLSGGLDQETIHLQPQEMKDLVRNSHIIIDQSDINAFPSIPSRFQSWLRLAGFASNEDTLVLSDHQVYSLDSTRNFRGSTDYFYRPAVRPDLLLRDLIRAQYSNYNPKVNYTMTFLNRGFSYEAKAATVLTEADCDKPVYNDEPIVPFVDPIFTGDGRVTAPPTGSGPYGGGSPSNQGGSGSGGGSSKTGIIVAVVVVAVLVGAGFAFAFFKWSKRAKEDRFIELEEEMNNEIPLH